MKQSSIGARVLRWFGIGIGIIVVILYIGLPAGMGVAAVLPAKAAAGGAPEGFEAVTPSASDGVQLKAWYRRPTNGAVIILLHGAGGTRNAMRPYAELLVRHGYGVLSVDLRGHGESEGQTNRLGWEGTRDVGAAVSFLAEQPEVQRIGALGSSMGGEVLLGAAAAYPAIRAIVADGATRRCIDEYLALETNRPLVRNFTARVMYATVQILTGDRPPSPLLDSMQAAQSTHFLLIAAGNNSLETAFNQTFATTLGHRAILWVAPAVHHTGAFARYPQEYEQRVIEFLQQELATTE